MLPALSIIVPSFNQGAYLEECLLSIISQHYPKIEIIIIDGGSTDNSTDVIEKYAEHIAYWVSEHDRGQSHAINKGIERATGEWIAWMNTDDCYYPHAFKSIFSAIDHTRYDFIYGNTSCGPNLQQAVLYQSVASDKDSLLQVLKFFYNVKHIIPSQSVWIRRELIATAGLLDESLHYCMDLDWYCRIFLATEKRYFYTETLSFFRMTPTSKSGSGKHNGVNESMQIARKYAQYLSGSQKKELNRYLSYYEWKLEMENINPTIWQLLAALLRFGTVAWNHPGFRIMVSKKLKKETRVALFQSGGL
jgi:glycosyltransferase involved in cell wall biosynthesis